MPRRRIRGTRAVRRGSGATTRNGNAILRRRNAAGPDASVLEWPRHFCNTTPGLLRPKRFHRIEAARPSSGQVAGSGSSPGKCRRAKVLLTTATGSVVARSRSVNLRPLSTGIRMVEKYLDVTIRQSNWRKRNPRTAWCPQCGSMGYASYGDRPSRTLSESSADARAARRTARHSWFWKASWALARSRRALARVALSSSVGASPTASVAARNA